MFNKLKNNSISIVKKLTPKFLQLEQKQSDPEFIFSVGIKFLLLVFCVFSLYSYIGFMSYINYSFATPNARFNCYGKIQSLENSIKTQSPYFNNLQSSNYSDSIFFNGADENCVAFDSNMNKFNQSYQSDLDQKTSKIKSLNQSVVEYESKIDKKTDEYDKVIKDKQAGQSKQYSIYDSDSYSIKSDIEKLKTQKIGAELELTSARRQLQDSQAVADLNKIIGITPSNQVQRAESSYDILRGILIAFTQIIFTLFIMIILSLIYRRFVRVDNDLVGTALKWNYYILAVGLVVLILSGLQVGTGLFLILGVFVSAFGILGPFGYAILYILGIMLGIMMLVGIQKLLFTGKQKKKITSQIGLCNKCGESIRRNSLFCNHCGTPTTKSCLGCKLRIKDGFKFCDNCGVESLD